jgi:hypothetical protein
MTKVGWLVICEKVIVDGRTNNPTLVNIFTNSYASSHEVPLSFIIAINFIDLNDGNHGFEVEIANTAGFSVKRGIDVPARNGGANIFLDVGGLKLPSFGKYTVTLLINNEPQLSAEFDFKKNES